MDEDTDTIKEVFHMALHTIFFHRFLGVMEFEEVESQFSNISYVNEFLLKIGKNKRHKLVKGY